MQADLPYLLPEAALRRLTGLVHLALRGFESESGQQFPLHLARATPHLTHLDLSENGFHSIPTVIMGLERLQCLKISRCPLRIWEQCTAVLTSLSKLRTLEMRKEGWSEDSGRSPHSAYYTWDRKSRELIDRIREQMPELIVRIDPIPREMEA